MDVLPTQLIPPPLVKLFLVMSHLLDALMVTFDEVNAKEENVQPLNIQDETPTMDIGEESNEKAE